MKSIEVYGGYAPKTEWLDDFFYKQGDFLSENSLTNDQIRRFKRFLQDAEMVDDKGDVTRQARILSEIRWDMPVSLGIMLANLAYTPQFGFYIKHMKIGRSYIKEDLQDMIREEGYTGTALGFVPGAYKRIVNDTPFGMSLNFGYVDEDGYFSRNKCYIGSPLVVLYSLYKYAENCGDYYEFTVSHLFDENIDSDGISPVLIFGTERDELETMLRGLSAKYPDFVNAAFTHDLEKISLNNQKISADVIELLEDINGESKV